MLGYHVRIYEPQNQSVVIRAERAQYVANSFPPIAKSPVIETIAEATDVGTASVEIFVIRPAVLA